MTRVLLLAGEESGLLYARQIAALLKAEYPNIEIRGYADYGFETHDLAVMGFFAVLKRLPFFLRVKRTMERAIDDWKPEAIVTVDYPGLNLKLAAYAKARRIRAVHVVAPQVWAWKANRIPKIEAALDHLCCFFPFEPALFKPGFATFIGHPLVPVFETLRAEEKARPASAHARPFVALLPGSRLGEIERILPTLLETVAPLDIDCVIPAANARAEVAINAVLAAHPNDRVRVRRGGAREVLLTARAAVVASGTATLEAALARCPTILVYKVDRFLAWFARRVIKSISHIGLANIIWEKCARHEANESAPMPELIQEDFTAENVRAHLNAFLTSPSARAEAVARLDETMNLLSSTKDPLRLVLTNLKVEC